jgi:hypothetical protein
VKQDNLFFIAFLTPFASRLFDHLIRTRQHVRRNRQADLLRRLEINHQLELSRLFDR